MTDVRFSAESIETFYSVNSASQRVSAQNIEVLYNLAQNAALNSISSQTLEVFLKPTANSANPKLASQSIEVFYSSSDIYAPPETTQGGNVTSVKLESLLSNSNTSPVELISTKLEVLYREDIIIPADARLTAVKAEVLTNGVTASQNVELTSTKMEVLIVFPPRRRPAYVP